MLPGREDIERAASALASRLPWPLGVFGRLAYNYRWSWLPDVWWFRPDGESMTTEDWERHDAHALMAFINGEELQERTKYGEHVSDDSFLLLLNAHHEDVDFVLPDARYGKRWTVELTTADREERQRGKEQDAAGPVAVMSRSLLLLRRLER